MAIIFLGSSIPGNDIPNRMPPDYLMHFTEYSILGGLIYWWAVGEALESRHPAFVILFSLVLSSVYGLFDEFHQSFVPGRSPDLADWTADTIGGLFGATIIMFWLLILKKRLWEKKSHME